MKTTGYFRNVAVKKHPGIKIEWIKQVMNNPLYRTVQPDGRIAMWGNVTEAEGRALRIITLEDGETVHNAFFDRNFWKRQKRGEIPK